MREFSSSSSFRSFLFIALGSFLLWSLVFTFSQPAIPLLPRSFHIHMKRHHEQENPLEHLRIKRDFMLSSGLNETDTDCFQQCNDEWKREFEREFKLNCTDFYDFPFHPAILQYSGYLKYCELADKQTRCFVEQCNDEAADRVFSPSNFLCHFKRSVFLTARPCLESTEPLNFLKCDRYCHLKAKEAAKHVPKRAHLGKVFSEDELAHYTAELDLLCRFQECYRECHREVVEESCAPALAAMTVDLVQSFIQSHAMEVYDWHLASKRLMPDSCLKLTGYKPEDDAILKIMSDIS